MSEAGENSLAIARQASIDGDWRSATREFAAADRETPLAPADLERFAQAAQCAGQLGSAVDPLERAVRAYLASDDRRDAARAAASLAQIHFERRELAVAKGWLSRATGYLSEEPESREHGLLNWISSRVALTEGNLERAASLGQEAYRIGKSRKDPDVEALGLLSWGLSLPGTGDVRRGIDLQDEAAAAVLGGGVTPWSGMLVYCGVIWGCLSRGDWRRAAEWTDQFERWCGNHHLEGLTGLCRLHRAEILTLRGELREAEGEITEASVQLAESAPWAEGDALRVLGEIHLAKGNLDQAEAAFRYAHEHGWEPQPGWAILLLARGRVDAAVRSLERAVNDTKWTNQHRRGALLAYLAVAAALGGDTGRAGKALQELDDHKELWSTPAFEATVLRARGEVALANGSVEEAVGHLRRSLQIWKGIGATLNAAEIRMRLAEILLETDPEAAELALVAAEAAYRKVAAPMRLLRCRELRQTIRARLFPGRIDKERFQEADRLLDAALDLPAAERGAFLDERCGDDRELHDLVVRLLREIDQNTSGRLATGSALEAFPDAFEVPLPELSGTALGRYEIVREIGRGGMGVVYEGRDGKLDRRVAIKVLALPAGGLATRERFEREARAAAALNHPNIVSIYDVGEASGSPYLVMELVPGTSLEESPPASLDEAIAIAKLVCEALEHAHGRGLVHRDLKPGNVLIVRDDGRLTVKLTDMGIALTRGAARVTRAGAIAGTPTYMAPEHASGKEVDGRADLYGLGVMLYAWTAGRLPFEGDDPIAIVSQHIHAPVVPPGTYRRDLPAGLEAVILQLLAKTPDLRFSSAREVRLALDAVGTKSEASH
jgi:tetratricopeptide (TPR) repeat protein